MYKYITVNVHSASSMDVASMLHRIKDDLATHWPHVNTTADVKSITPKGDGTTIVEYIVTADSTLRRKPSLHSVAIAGLLFRLAPALYDFGVHAHQDSLRAEYNKYVGKDVCVVTLDNTTATCYMITPALLVHGKVVATTDKCLRLSTADLSLAFKENEETLTIDVEYNYIKEVLEVNLDAYRD